MHPFCTRQIDSAMIEFLSKKILLLISNLNIISLKLNLSFIIINFYILGKYWVLIHFHHNHSVQIT